VSSLSLSANQTEPQVTGTPITWSAVATGGSPLTYKWFIFDGSTYSIAADWSSSSSFTWTPTVANANYRVLVWVKSASNPAEPSIASAEKGFAIQVPTSATSPRVSSVTISANKVAPQVAGTAITWSASASGGTGPLAYKWWIFDGASWNYTTNWTTSSTFAWAPTVANPRYAVGVWVKSADNPADEYEASSQATFAITGNTTMAPPPW
jgi:N-acetylmuramoyl-L-alanine amidase